MRSKTLRSIAGEVFSFASSQRIKQRSGSVQKARLDLFVAQVFQVSCRMKSSSRLIKFPSRCCSGFLLLSVSSTRLARLRLLREKAKSFCVGAWSMSYRGVRNERRMVIEIDVPRVQHAGCAGSTMLSPATSLWDRRVKHESRFAAQS
jgi:hypothetical protein